MLQNRNATFLFYDLETTGLNPAFDQILQFAAIRTDQRFQVLEETQLQVRLRPDVIPSPYAVMTHRIPLSEMQQGISELTAVRKIHELFNQPGTISLGYNTLKFDDEFMRFAFFRNLLPPYTHQFANQCRRMDLYPITIFYYLYARDSLTWPMPEGRLSLKLEQLNAANGLAAGRAHDAMVDVRATLALAQKLSMNTSMWEYCLGYFQKEEDQRRMQGLEMGICVDGSLGREATFRAPVLHLGQHRHYKNQTLWLRLDTEALTQTVLSDIPKTTWAVRKKLGEPGFILPEKERFWAGYDEARRQLMQRNLQFLEAQPKLMMAITDYYLEYQYPECPTADADSVLYQSGFLSDQDQRLAREFHQASPALRPHYIPQFSSVLLRTLAERLNWRENCEEVGKTLYLAREHQSIMDYKGQLKLTVEEALRQIAVLRAESTDPEVLALLSSLSDWLVQAER